MTPSQLRAYAAVVRTGSVKEAARALEVSEPAISGQVAALRRELNDQLFTRAGAGLAFTPGGLRLATRAAEMLGLQDQTIREVSEAAQGRRLLRVAASSLFAEHGAPGLFQLFTSRAKDLDVEMGVHPPSRFAELLAARAIDAAIGPQLPASSLGDTVVQRSFLKFERALVAAPAHPLAQGPVRPGQLRDQRWLLGPSATGPRSHVAALLRQHEVPEDGQRIFQSHAAAIEEIKRGNGIGPVVTFAVADDLAAGNLVRLQLRGGSSDGTWAILTLPNHSVSPPAAELTRFVATPRATQAMLLGADATIGHFKPSVHITLWS